MLASNRHTALLAGFIGNVVAWYDFALCWRYESPSLQAQ